MTYIHHRYYDSSLGRFITEDPAKDGLNWYVYCNNNPMRYVDPDGLWFNGWTLAAYSCYLASGLIIGMQAGGTVVTGGAAAMAAPGTFYWAAALFALGRALEDTGKVVDKLTGDDVIIVTPDGVAMPPGYTIPEGLVENPHGRAGSYGYIDPITGKFVETFRIDPPTPAGKKGSSDESHFHIDKGKDHLTNPDELPGNGEKK